MQYADIFFVIIFSIIVVHAGVRGFVEEVTGAAWLAGGALISLSFYREGAAFIRTKFFAELPYIPEAMAFIGLFLIAFVAIKLIGGMLRDIIERTGLVTADRLLGFVFGIAKGFIVIAALVFLARRQPLVPEEQIIGGSRIAAFFIKILSIAPGKELW